MMNDGLRDVAAGSAVLLWSDRGPMLPEEILSRLVLWNDRGLMPPEEILSSLSDQLRATQSSHAG